MRAAPTALVSGRIVDEDGDPVRHLRVQLQESRPSRRPRWKRFAYGETDRDGRYTLRNLLPPAQQSLRVVAGADREGPGASEPFTLEIGERREGLEMEVASPGVVEGDVFDADGKPMTGVRVLLFNLASRSAEEVLADRAGRYRFPEVEAGGLRIEVYARGSRRPVWQSELFEVEAGQTVEIDVVPR